MSEFLPSLCSALELPETLLEALHYQSAGALPSTFAVTDFASASIAAAGLAVAGLLQQQCHHPPKLRVDRRLASFWFATSIRPQGWSLPPLWDAVAGDYETHDGWIRLHTNAAHHRAAAERVLGHYADRSAMARQVAQWSGTDLETAVVEAGGCAAQMRSWPQWQAHPQGQAVNAEPLIHWQHNTPIASPCWTGTLERPLAGVKVLDLTRILAGPTASRLLAGLGADVLRIDPPGWEEPSVVAEVTLGKRCARLDLRASQDRVVFEHLLRQADFLLHGYRADALERLGYDSARRQQLAPGLIDVALNAYGWSGPWQHRRGFDSLVQMSCGIADAGMQWQQAEKPVPLPVQALDHGTGYLMAAAAIKGLTERLASGRGSSARLSLARTAKLLIEHENVSEGLPLSAETQTDLAPGVEQTPWGAACRIKSPLLIDGAPLRWEAGACELGSSPAQWR